MEASRFLSGEIANNDNPYTLYGLPESDEVRPYKLFEHWSLLERHQVKLPKTEQLKNILVLGYPANVVPLAGYVLELSQLIDPESDINLYLEMSYAKAEPKDIAVQSLESRINLEKAIDMIVKRQSVTDKLEEAYGLYSSYQKTELAILKSQTQAFDDDLPTISRTFENIQKIKEVKEMVPVPTSSQLRPVYGKRLLQGQRALTFGSKNVLRIVYAWEKGIKLPPPQSPLGSV